MADLGKPLDLEMLCLVTGRDFKWEIEHRDPQTKQVTPWPAGELFLELETGGARDHHRGYRRHVRVRHPR